MLLEHISSPGEEGETHFDEAYTLKGAGLKNVTAKRRMRLSATADDTALTFTAAAMLFIWSRNGVGFKVKLTAGQTMTGLLQSFMIGGLLETTTALGTSVLLTGDGANEADLEIWIVEKI